MRKIIQRYGDAYIIRLTREERTILNLKEGDVIDLEIKKEVKK